MWAPVMATKPASTSGGVGCGGSGVPDSTPTGVWTPRSSLAGCDIGFIDLTSDGNEPAPASSPARFDFEAPTGRAAA